MKRVLLVALAACGAKAAAPCERGAKVEIRVVDHDSPYMKKAFTRANPDRDGTSQDPEAIAAGVRADIDMWRRDTADDELPAERQTDYFLVGQTREGLAGYLMKLDKLPDDRELRIERTDAGFRSYYVGKRPIIETRHIAGIALDDGHINVDLTAEGRALFATATADAAKHSRKLATLVDGEVTSAPIINSAIKGGRFWITTPDAPVLATKLACVTASSR